MKIYLYFCIITIFFYFVTAYDSLTNKNASPSAKLLYNYLIENYGKKIITGQVGQAGYIDTEEIDYIKKTTGKTPAMFNVDFIFESPEFSWKPDTSVADMVLSWWKKYEGKGIMHIQWHWNKSGDDGVVDFYSKQSTFDISKAVIEGTKEYESAISDMDYIASQLKIMQEKDIPIIWRPFHEANGGWFWWGAKGPQPCVELYKIMYKRFTEYHQLNNLIWCWNGGVGEWYPGNEYVDIISEDIYNSTHGSYGDKYDTLYKQVGDRKIIAMSENGSIPDISACVKEKKMWSFFCTWNNYFILNNSENVYNTPEFVDYVYNNVYSITQSDLPSFATQSLDYEVKETKQGFPTCQSCTVTATGTDGKSYWGWENNESCRIDTDKCFNNNNNNNNNINNNINNGNSTITDSLTSKGFNKYVNTLLLFIILSLSLIYIMN